MNSFWIIKVTYDDGSVSISSDGYSRLVDAKQSLDNRLSGEVRWISEFICRQIVDGKVHYYELHSIDVVK